MEYKLFLWVSHSQLNILKETGVDTLLLSWLKQPLSHDGYFTNKIFTAHFTLTQCLHTRDKDTQPH